MNQEYKIAALSVKLLELKDFSAEHIRWLQEELKKPNNFVWDEGRKVMVQTQDGVDVIEIPSKENRVDFINAWLKVYNTCLATLDIDVKIICLKRKHVRKQYDQIIVGNYRPVQIPADTKSVKYVMALEEIISNYKRLLNNDVKQVAPIKVEKHEVTLKPIAWQEMAKVSSPAAPSMPKVTMPTVTEKPSVPISKEETKPLVESKTTNYQEIKKPEPNEEIVKEVIEGQKIPDDEKIEKEDCNYFKEKNVPFVLVTCTHLDKGENTFLSNAEICEEEGLNLGAYFNGKAKNIDGAIKDSKKILKLLNGITVKGPVIYEINLDYLKTHDSSEEIGEIIQAYNGVASVLTENGYNVLIAMDLDSGVLIDRQIKRDNIPNIYPIIYRIVPREMDRVSSNDSYVLMDPQYDNDIVKIVNPTFEIENKKQLKAA